ncbi:hypothetical protein AJ90_26065 [Vibrio parahaemolyticus M0605]|nr:hypothetical protein AJ90_26065 [Vibrio parahaemolyticus M0605]
MSLRAKLIWPILVFITAIFVASKGYTSYTAYQSSKHELVEQTRKLINNVSYSIKDALTTKNKRKAQTILADLLEQPNVSRVKLYDRANEPFFVLEGSGESAPVPNQNERSKLDALGYALSAKFLYVLEPIIHEGHVIGSIRVTLSHIPIINAQHSFLKDAGILLLILAAGGIIFYITIDRIILRPLLDLNGAIQDVTFGNASHVQIRHHSKDELGEVIHAFNRMMTKLRKREKQRQHSLATLEQKRAFSEEVIESIQYALVITDNLAPLSTVMLRLSIYFRKHRKH